MIDELNNITAEDWESGETIKVTKEDKLEFEIATDCRFIPNGMRSYTDEMYPEYLAIGADKWVFWTEEELNIKYPKRPKT